MARNLRNMFHRASLTERTFARFAVPHITYFCALPRGADDRIVKPRVAAISKGEPDPATADDTLPADDGARAQIPPNTPKYPLTTHRLCWHCANLRARSRFLFAKRFEDRAA